MIPKQVLYCNYNDACDDDNTMTMITLSSGSLGNILEYASPALHSPQLMLVTKMMMIVCSFSFTLLHWWVVMMVMIISVVARRYEGQS